MATYLSGNVRKTTPNTVAAMKRSADRRRCPKCGRGSAMLTLDGGARACRWGEQGLCDHYEPSIAEREGWVINPPLPARSPK